jgi:transposase-like protein
MKRRARRDYTPQQKLAHVAALRESGLTHLEYAKRHDLTLSALTRWSNGRGLGTPGRAKRTAIVPVTVNGKNGHAVAVKGELLPPVRKSVAAMRASALEQAQQELRDTREALGAFVTSAFKGRLSDLTGGD